MANDKMKKGSKTVNSTLRVSDIVKLKWKDVFYEIGELKKDKQTKKSL